MREDANTIENKNENDAGLLVLGRRPGQSIVVDGPAVIEVLETREGRVKLGVRAPRSTLVLRGELEARPQVASDAAASLEGVTQLMAEEARHLADVPPARMSRSA